MAKQVKTIEYKEDFGEINFPEGFEEKLKGKTLEEQMEMYRITESSKLSRTSYGEIDSESLTNRCFKLPDYKKFRGVVVKDELIVGVIIEEYFFKTDTVCLPYKGVCVYYASDNNGSGYQSCDDSAYLICI